jgi:hypothetical protein
MSMSSKRLLTPLVALLVVGVAIYLLTTGPAAAPAALESCEIATYSEADIPLPLTCEQDIGNGVMVILTIAVDGTLRVEHKGKLIFANPIEDGTDYIYYNVPQLRSGGVTFQDFTYDGYQDIALLIYAGAYNYTTAYFAYDPAKGTYASEQLLEAVNAGVDTDAREISSFSKGRGLGDIYTARRYHFEDGAYVLVYEEVQSMVSDEGLSEEGYVRVIRERKNGAMMETAREALTEADVWGESEE